jgi:hypothetical protein
MNREERFIRFYNAVHTKVTEYFSLPEECKFGKDSLEGEDYSLVFSLDPSGEVHTLCFLPSRYGLVNLGAAAVVVCVGPPAYFAKKIDPTTNAGQNPNHLSYQWEEDLHNNLAKLLQFIEDEPFSEVRWPDNADYWRERAYDGTAFDKGWSWLRKMAAASGKVTYVVYSQEEMRKGPQS